jgi:REP element-mobilizing transposase RayT
MARPLRILCSGLTYHVHSRGNGGMLIFRDDVDRARFLELLEETVESHRVTCHSYCQMSNHYHALVTTACENLSTAVKYLNGSYAQWWNRRYGRTGHLFQGRFTAHVIQDGDYFLEATRYLELNPVRGRIVEQPEKWRWSSYRAAIGLNDCPEFLSLERVWTPFGVPGTAGACRGYRSFVESALGTAVVRPRAIRRGDGVIGDQAFAQDLLKHARASSEVPRRHREAGRPTLDQLFASAVRRADRDAAIAIAHRYQYSGREIADSLGVHYTTVSKVLGRLRKGSRGE